MTLPVLFDGVPNSRPVAGLPLKSGGKIRDGVLYRSSALHRITPEGLTEFAATPVNVVADLRTVPERMMAKDEVHLHPRVEKVDLGIEAGSLGPGTLLRDRADLLKAGAAPADLEELGKEMQVPSLEDMYRTMLSDASHQFARVARLVAQVEPGMENAVLVHCTAGKDRTGISVALMLDAVGTDRDAIIENYSVSQDYLAGPWAEGMLAKLHSLGIPPIPQLVQLVTTTPPSAIEAAFTWVEENFGGSVPYLQSGGLQTEEVDGLHAALT